ncbi:ATP-dependent protease ATPase subunit HslU [Thermoanaerobacterium thermosaccharolyticum]|uniref:ATP-dependent protease ATPase subunit HslU n=2 Tax=Thermoanaerobacterium thermosaccharolyticum TaxID=1517 RepID=D9TN64_THETC|nr:ATP-dependent protease ATPase subunit HslU [Thermoanaerobacterium thermosaccharolyticum]ADL68974.1 heat shock protein HslVU, ATPase subunit HslU [Thermoanaerobacterium thermosaccharolyticum DSM 571]KAA5807781.1 ATP-dependent protease ATPase subunit HslU [Thermoanaerobacterium thermosaccharolyticum]MBE0068011.1 ATP-dependent protease ATPase subunit HslU [Thermoanaerobacterium thermosaccharolyticum]MBE0227755.1 ATP-dependent protease ATPase subunit HslU [Thermoanaerobacterium thermosaccharolyt
MKNYTPKEIVDALDKYIVGQDLAKRSVAVALRNRFRRNLLPDEIKDEVTPKNILMIGPTGVGKTEIARRIAKLVEAPFVKVEATKFTEVGYVGRDVESMIRDLLESAIRMVKQEKMQNVMLRAKELAEERIVDYLLNGRKNKRQKNPFEFLFNAPSNDEVQDDEQQEIKLKKAQLKEKIRNGELNDTVIEIEITDSAAPILEMYSNIGSEEMNINLQDMFSDILPKKKKYKKVPIGEAKKILESEEAQNLIDMDEVIDEAIKRTEQDGIIFIDEIDKIAGSGYTNGPDVSREGVQRDILPIVEGSTVMTKYGPVKTDYILFIAAGAFNVSKVSDLIPELQGRFPVRVELKPLTKEDFIRILKEPKNALTKQYAALLKTEGVDVEYSDDAIDRIAEIAYLINQQSEDIGARRLHTVMEKLFEKLSFEAPEITGKKVIIDRNYIDEQLKDNLSKFDVNKYIL